ncbi:ABC transporter G family member 39 [Vitis vinifera]|uniref:ABC transporter G family member 39 n=1 Tax=Vitis vinifera TaxID=29760 RepID=A0A438FVY7_VITVI|nr:ABC transporter G family member 39 [Vitis vinifera]
MTVRETLASQQCQGVGTGYGGSTKRAGRQCNYRLDSQVCADTIVGDEMVQGISGGQKRRLTTGEMLVGPAKALSWMRYQLVMNLLFRLTRQAHTAALTTKKYDGIRTSSIHGGTRKEHHSRKSFGSFALLAVLVMGGFVYDVKPWDVGLLGSPMMYGQNAIVVNEFLGKGWKHVPKCNKTVGVLVLKSRGIFLEAHWYWLGVGALIGYVFLFNFLFTMALAYLNPYGKHQTVLSIETLTEQSSRGTGSTSELEETKFKVDHPDHCLQEWGPLTMLIKTGRRMILPFEPLSITLDEIRYAVDMPQEMKAQGIPRTD